MGVALRIVLGSVIAACGARTDLGHEQTVLAPDADNVPTCDLTGDPSPNATTSYGTCGEGVNTSLSATGNCHFGGGATSAFEYVPAADVTIRRIEIFTDHGKVGLLDSDDCGGPGVVLFKGDLDSSGDEPDWRGANLDHAIAVRAGHKYFVWQGPGDYPQACSVAEDPTSTGTVFEYTHDGTSDPNGGPWHGPFKGTAWTARLIGLCP